MFFHRSTSLGNDEEGWKKSSATCPAWIQTLFHRIGLLYGILSAITLGLQFCFARILQDKFPSDQIMFFRSIFMYVLLPQISWQLASEHDSMDLLLYILYGIFNVAGLYISYLALNFTNVGNVNAIAINLTIPTAILGNFFLGEEVGVVKFVMLFINLVGVTLIANPSVLFSKGSVTVNDFYGGCLAFVALISMTLSRITARKSALRVKMDASLMTLMSGAVGVPFCLSILMFSSWAMPSALWDWFNIASYVLLSLFANQFAMRGVEYESACNISALTSLSVPLAYIVGLFYLKDDFKVISIVGATLVVGSTFLSLLGT
ncbi:hypothetical protein HOLleu_03809 [Holothuria leucospilota]|uniref:EamA domain-containing protein n=1 Tax=Holothuria leucospilota TaxID=206669 RepID=A0A9Q1CSG9_HOLLE|nr:hypothetical protein HOLleu_03809 [Holothuria leucospilota]